MCVENGNPRRALLIPDSRFLVFVVVVEVGLCRVLSSAHKYRKKKNVLNT